MKIYDLVNVRSRGDFEALMHKYVTNFERLMQSVAAEEDAGLK
jgi:hypothetical protein